MDTLRDEIVVPVGGVITEEIADAIQQNIGVLEADIRSVLTCEAKQGYVLNVMAPTSQCTSWSR